MDFIFDILEIIWQVIWGFISAIGSAIWESLPEIMDIKKIMDNFTPIGMTALYLGVPACVISGIVWIGKRIVKGNLIG